MHIDILETSSLNYEALSTSACQLWRNVRIIDTTLDKAVFADGSYCKGSHLGYDVLLNKGSFVLNSKIGDKTQIGFNTKVLYSSIGKYCSISWDCSIGGSNHNILTISTYNFRHQNHYAESECSIGNDVWMGSGVIMLRGVLIGNGAVIGGGSVLTHNVLPYEIVAGVPARHLGWRFEESIRDQLNKLEWWNFPISVIENHLDLFDGVVNDETLAKLERLKQKL